MPPRLAKSSKTEEPRGDTAPGLVPRLRFPEFSKSKPWRLTALHEVLYEHGLKSDRKSEVHSVSLTSGVVPQVEHMGRSFAAADTSHYSLVRPLDIVYTRSPLAVFRLGIVKQHRRTHDAIVSPLYGVFAPTNKYVGQLIESFFDSPARSVGFLDPLAQKGAKNTIQLSNERFLSGRIYLPEDEREQRTIADCLTWLDDLIAAQGRKVETLMAHKKGLMQNLFPREGETVPRLRFPEFRDEWIEKLLEELAESISSGKDKAAPNGIYDLYGSTGIIGKTDSAPYRGKHLLAARVGANAGLLTKAIGQFGVTDNTLVIILKSPCSIDFVHYHLSSLGLNKMIFGSGQPLITGGQLKSLSLRLPSEAEQRRVANCLTSLDAGISAEAAALTALKAHKKGLIQGLFPSPEDV